MDKLKALFFWNTLRHWHFEDLVAASGQSRERVHHYLLKLCKENVIQRIKPRGKMPYYRAKYETPKFCAEKRIFGLYQLEQSGLFEHLLSLENIKTAILFGSFSRGDWDKSSDVDLFIYGDNTNMEKSKFELKLGRELQVFSFSKPAEIKKQLEPALLRNIAKGFNIKGNLEPFEVIINA